MSLEVLFGTIKGSDASPVTSVACDPTDRGVVAVQIDVGSGEFDERRRGTGAAPIDHEFRLNGGRIEQRRGRKVGGRSAERGHRPGDRHRRSLRGIGQVERAGGDRVLPGARVGPGCARAGEIEGADRAAAERAQVQRHSA
jgi:hypothetical protein